MIPTHDSLNRDMKGKGRRVFFLISLILGSLTAQAESVADLSTIKQLYQQKDYEKVIEEGSSHLEHYQNNDPDIRYFVGLAYYQKQQYDEAAGQFRSALDAYPEYLEVRKAYINTLIAQKNYKKVKPVIDAGLVLNPKDAELWMDKVRLYVLQRQNETARSELKQLLSEHPNYEPALSMQRDLKLMASISADAKKAKKKPKKISKKPAKTKQPVKQQPTEPAYPYYDVGIGTSIMGVTLPDQTWNYSTLYLYRSQEKLSYGAELNYANRLNRQAYQGGLVVSPKLSDKTWFNFAYYYANQPALFPDQTFFGNINQVVLKDFVLSASASHKKIASTYFNTYEGGVSVYFGDWSFQAGPIYYQTKSGPDSILYRFHLRHYFDDPDTYFGLIVMSGYSPDLFDLLTVNFFRVHEKIIMGESQFRLGKQWFVRVGGGYENQQFLNNLNRDIFYLNLGLKYRFDHVT